MRLNRPTIQTLRVGAVNDPLEREADEAAARVVNGREAFPRRSEEREAPVQTAAEDAKASHRETEEAAQARRDGDESRARREEEQARAVRRAAPEGGGEAEAWPPLENGELEQIEQSGVEDTESPGEAPEGEVQPMRDAAGGPAGGAIQDASLASRIQSPGPGRALPPAQRGRMEEKFDADFSAVRVHDNAVAQADTRALGARALAHGSNVFLASGESAGDTRLMAHELTHVVQQGSAPRRSRKEQPQRTPATQGGQQVRAIRRIPDWVLEKLRGWAMNIPGYHLLTFVIGWDPILGKPVERSALNLVRAVMSLVPGGDALYRQIQESGVLAKAAAWFSEEFAKLQITWTLIKSLFSRALDSIGWKDALSPGSAWDRIVGIFRPTLHRVANFARNVKDKILELIFEAVMSRAGPLANRILSTLRKGANVFGAIIANPIGFLGNVLNAIGTGFRQFVANIGTHLKTGLMKWLFGTLAKAGIQLPKEFTLKSVVGLVMQILGLTYARVRQTLVDRIGEERVAYIEKAVAFVKVLVTEGLAGAWKMIVEAVGNLKDMVLGAIQAFVRNKIITAAVTKILSMFNPAGAVVQAILTLYNVIKWLIERIEQILDVVNSVLDSLGAIVAGRIGAAANFIEKTLGRTVPVVISFLAGLLGLGGIADRIKEVIKKVQDRIQQAIGKVIDWIIAKAKSLFEKAKKAAASVVQWWKKRKETNVGKKTYAAFFEGKETDAKLSLEGSPSAPYQEYLSGIKDKVQGDAAQAAHARALVLGAEIESDVRGNPMDDAKGQVIDKKLGEMADLMAKMGSSMVAGERPPSIIRWDPVNAMGGGTGMNAELLSWEPGKNQGSGVQDMPPIMAPLQGRKSDHGATAFFQGHLLNEGVHGPGKRFNLSPITPGANSEHKEGIEKDLVAHVQGGGFAKYKVIVNYKGHEAPPDLLELRKKKDAGTLTADEQWQLSVMEHEQTLSTGFSWEAAALEKEGDEWVEVPSELKPGSMESKIPTKAPQSDGSTRVAELVQVDLSVRSGGDEQLKALQQLKGMGIVRAKAIDAKGPESWKEVREIKGIDEGLTKQWGEQTNAGGELLANFGNGTVWK